MAVGKVLATAAVSVAVAGSSMAFELSHAEEQRQQLNEANAQNEQITTNYKSQIDQLKKIISQQTNDLNKMSKKFNAPDLGEDQGNYMDQINFLERDIYKTNWYTDNILMNDEVKDKINEIKTMNDTIEQANSFVEVFNADVEQVKTKADLAASEVAQEKSDSEVIIEKANEALEQINPIYR